MFMACPGYSEDPPCKTIRKLTQKQQQKPPQPTGEDCPVCGKPLVLRQGAYGEFVSCSGYPKCKYIKQNLIEGMKCPKCGEGDMAERKARRGNIFWGCTNYPKCDFTSNYKPVPTEVPRVRQPVPRRENAQSGIYLECPNKKKGAEEESAPKKRGKKADAEFAAEGDRRLHLLQAHRRCAASADRGNPRARRGKGERQEGTAARMRPTGSFPPAQRDRRLNPLLWASETTHGTNARYTGRC